MEAEALVIKLGLDPSKFKAGLEQLKGGLETVKNNAQTAAKKTAQGMQEASKATAAVGQQAGVVSKQINGMATSAAGSIKGMLAAISGPLLGLFSIGSLAAGWASDVAKVAEETGAYNKKLEEARKKKELYSRVTKEDIELYKKSQYAMATFSYAVQSLGNSFFRLFNGPISKLMDWLNKIGDWISRNEQNITRFLTVIAGIITTLLTPAIIKMTLAWLASPLGLMITLFTGLALIIDDLVTYIQGGESALADFWAIFGTGPEIAAKVSKAWEMLKRVGVAAFEVLKATWNLFCESFGGALEPWIDMVANWFQMLGAVLEGNWSEAWEHCKAMFASAWDFFIELIAGALNFIFTIFDGIFEAIVQVCVQAWDTITNALKEAFNKAAQWVLNIFRNIVNTIKGWIKAITGMIPSLDGIKKGASDLVDSAGNAMKSGWNTVKSFFGGGDEEKAPASVPTQKQATAPIAATIPTQKQATAASVAPNITKNETKNTQVTNTTNVGGVTVHVAQGDPAAIADGIGGELAKLPTPAMNTGVAQ